MPEASHVRGRRARISIRVGRTVPSPGPGQAVSVAFDLDLDSDSTGKGTASAVPQKGARDIPASAAEEAAFR
jgi:hypothetical protein